MHDTYKQRWPRDMNSIKEHLDHLDVDVSRAVASYYILKTIHREASRRSDIRQALNSPSWAWSYILFSLQCAFFIQIERIFHKSTVYNVNKVVAMSIDHAEQNAPATLPSLRRLERLVNRYAEMARPYRNIRNKIVAHPALLKPADITDCSRRRKSVRPDDPSVSSAVCLGSEDVHQ